MIGIDENNRIMRRLFDVNKQVKLKWNYFSKQLDIRDLRLEDSMSDMRREKRYLHLIEYLSEKGNKKQEGPQTSFCNVYHVCIYHY